MGILERTEETLGLTACGAVAKCYGFDAEALHKHEHTFLRVDDVVARRCGIDHIVVQQVAVGVETHNFAAGAETGIDTHYPPGTEGCAQQQLLQVRREGGDGALIGAQFGVGLSLVGNGWTDEATICVGHGIVDYCVACR